MSPRAAGWVLFLVAFATVPLPLLGLEGARVPAARFAQLAAVMLGLVWHEGAGGMVGTLVLLFVGHAVVYTGLVALAAWGVARLVLPHLRDEARRTFVVLVAVALLLAASFGQLYDTPFHHASAHARLAELYR